MITKFLVTGIIALLIIIACLVDIIVIGSHEPQDPVVIDLLVTIIVIAILVFISATCMSINKIF